MKRFIDVCRLVFVSTEALCVALLAAGVVLRPQLFSRIGELLQSNDEGLKYLITVPVALLGVCVKLSWNILFPNDNGKVLLEWEGYQRLKDRAYFSVSLCICCAAVAFSIWIFKPVVPYLWLTAGGLFAWCIPLVTTATAYMAAHKIRELSERYR